MNLLHHLLTLTLTALTTAQTSTLTTTQLPFPSHLHTPPKTPPNITYTCYLSSTNHRHLYGLTGIKIWNALPEITPQLSGLPFQPSTKRKACWTPPAPNFRVVFSITSGHEVEGYLYPDPVWSDESLVEEVFGGVLERCRLFGGEAVVEEGDWVFMIQSEAGQCGNFDGQEKGK